MGYAYRQAFQADLSRQTMSEQTRTNWAKVPVQVGVLAAKGTSLTATIFPGVCYFSHNNTVLFVITQLKYSQVVFPFLLDL